MSNSSIKTPADTIEISWHIDDVKQVRPHLTDAQAREVLAHAKHRHDADIGINWDVLAIHADVTRMPHLPRMCWDFHDRLRATTRQVLNEGTPEETWYVYAGAGHRTRKVTTRRDGGRKNERLYLGGFEVFRAFNSAGSVELERETLHVMDDKHRIALVETLTVDDGETVVIPNPTQRDQLANHLGSASLELGGEDELISYEEYSPHGRSIFQAGRNAAEVSLKRYRYTGKERDEENGFTYNGARYYAPWLAGWMSCDPNGLTDGPNLYRYARNSPTRFTDTGGRDPTPSDDERSLKDDARLRAIGITRKELIDYASMTKGNFFNKYSTGSYLGDLKFWWNFPKDQIRALPGDLLYRVLPKQDNTLYLQPSGRISTNESEKALQVANFDPGTPLGGVASVATRGVAAAVGASPENTELAAGIAGAVGNLVNAGLAVPGSASRGIVPARGGAAYGPPNTTAVPVAEPTTPTAEPEETTAKKQVALATVPKFASRKLEIEHGAKHGVGVIVKKPAKPIPKEGGADVPEGRTISEYSKLARFFFSGHPEGVEEALVKGQLYRYDPKTGFFGILSKEGKVRTLFRPDKGREYFLKAVKEALTK